MRLTLALSIGLLMGPIATAHAYISSADGALVWQLVVGLGVGVVLYYKEAFRWLGRRLGVKKTNSED